MEDWKLRGSSLPSCLPLPFSHPSVARACHVLLAFAEDVGGLFHSRSRCPNTGDAYRYTWMFRVAGSSSPSYSWIQAPLKLLELCCSPEPHGSQIKWADGGREWRRETCSLTHCWERCTHQLCSCFVGDNWSHGFTQVQVLRAAPREDTVANSLATAWYHIAEATAFFFFFQSESHSVT